MKRFALFFLPLLMLSPLSFAFTTLDGELTSIDDYLGNGKWTIVEIWKSDCHSCRTHMPEMVQFDGKLENAQLVGISLDGAEGINDAKKFSATFNMKFPTLVSSFQEVSTWMERVAEEPLIGTPTFIIFDAKGNVAAAQAGIVPVKSLEKFIVQNSQP